MSQKSSSWLSFIDDDTFFHEEGEVPTSQKNTFWVILPVGTKIADGGYEGSPSFRLVQPAAAFITMTWENSFLVEALKCEDGTGVETGLASNYVMQPPENFAQGATEKEAWAKFRSQKYGKAPWQ